MDKLDEIMKEADRLGFGASYGKYQLSLSSRNSPVASKSPSVSVSEKPSANCKHCGKHFVKNHANQAYCSPECQYAVKLARQNAWDKVKGRRRKEPQVFICAECGADFTALRCTSKYCGRECAHKGGLKAQARWRAAQKKEG